MKIILLFIIKIYWKFIPDSKRRVCLFKTSCSNYVYKNAKEKGLVAGLKALKFRIKNCNANYTIIKVKKKVILITGENIVFEESEINDYLLNFNKNI